MWRRWLAPSLLFFAAASAGIAFARHCPGCIEADRVNRVCEWTGDAPFHIDVQDALGQRHLVADAQLAEELAIRFADAEFDRLYGYEAHGGAAGNARSECMARLVAAIERNHAVTPEQIALARGQRNVFFDMAAALSFVPLYLLAAFIAAGLLDRRFSADRRSVRLIATGLGSIVAPVLGLQAGQLWLGVFEAIRVRNGHISIFRAATYTIWTHRHVGALVATGILAFWAASACWRRTTLRNVTDGAAKCAGTMLAAMFADVFVQSLGGYVILAAVLVVFHRLASGDERAAAVPEPGGVLVR